MDISVKRPTNKESDEDLIKQQELFLKQNVKPAVQLVKESERQSKECTAENKITEAEELSSDNSTDSCVHLEIKECTRDFSKMFTFQAPGLSTSLHPRKPKISEKRNKSIFAQKQENNVTRTNHADQCRAVQEPHITISDATMVGCSSDEPASLEKEFTGIHEENLEKISQMSKQEILEFQEQLKKRLSPDVINFLKSRKQNPAGRPKGEIKYVKFCNNPIDHAIGDTEVIRKEGKDSDAILLEKAFQSECDQHFSVKENKIDCNDEPKENIELPEETQELLEDNARGQWLNMKKVEKEKMEWMTKLPPPKPVDLQTGYVARFDFEGKLLSREVDNASTLQGLHHHSSEPEVAGYSLEELFLLSRSTLQSQRVTALQTIARILENYWYGKLDACFDVPLLPILLQAGIVPLLRWSLDDTTASSIAVAVAAIHSLLVCRADEICLDRTFFWMNGIILPQLESQDLDPPSAVEELTDADLIKLDVIKGWLRIDILARFRYLLELPLMPPPSICQLILEICIRLVQHSTESAQKVAEHPGFLEMIFRKFLPVRWPYIDKNQWNSATNFVYPMHSAMKLMRIIASSSKELALLLVNDYNTLDVIRCYLTIQPTEGNLPMKDVQQLMVESLKMWQLLLTYGLAVEIYFDLFPIFLRQFDFCQSLSLKSDIKKHMCDFQYTTAFLKALEAVIALAAKQDASFSILRWDQVETLLMKAEVCLKKWLWEFSQSSPTMVSMDLLGACLNFVSTFYKKSHENLICEELNACRSAKEIFKQYLIPCLLSESFKDLLDNISSYSVLLNSSSHSVKRDVPTLVSLNSILWRDDVVPILREKSPLSLILAVLNYTNGYKRLFIEEGNMVTEIILSGSVREYLRSLIVKPLNSENWFSRFEVQFICELIDLSSETNDVLFYHQVAVAVIPCFKWCDAWLLKELLENVVFNEKFSIHAREDKVSNALLSGEDIAIIKTTISKFPSIANCYISSLQDSENIKRSQCLFQRNFLGLESVAFQIYTKQIMQKNWSYVPILSLFQKTQTSRCPEVDSEEDISSVLCCLQWTHMCNVLDPMSLKSVPLSAKFYFLNLVFLLDPDLFREDSIQQLLKAQLSQLLRQKTKLVDESTKINDAPPFEEVYIKMLIQFESVSYGDHLFGSFILLPLQQSYSNQWKKMLYAEHALALRFLGVPLADLLVPVENYLEPLEKDNEILGFYFNLLSTGVLNRQRCPLVYLMAIHHLHGLVFMEMTDKPLNFQKAMTARILKSKKDEIRRHILLYSGFSKDESLGFTMKTVLSPDCQKHLSNICDADVLL